MSSFGSMRYVQTRRTLLEKERQIPIMRDIFLNARRLLAWLHGPFDQLCIGDANYAAADVVAYDNTLLVVPHELGTSEVTLLALVRLLFHEYWSRIWIVQELRLAHAREFWWEGQVLQSEQLEDIGAFVRARVQGNRFPNWLSLIGREIGRDASSSNLLNHLTFATSSRVARFMDRHSETNLAALVINYTACQCTLTYDHVFGLIGLIDIDKNTFRVAYDMNQLELLAQIWNTSGIRSESDLRHIGEALGIKWPMSIDPFVREYSIEFADIVGFLDFLEAENYDLWSSSFDLIMNKELFCPMIASGLFHIVERNGSVHKTEEAYSIAYLARHIGYEPEWIRWRLLHFGGRIVAREGLLTPYGLYHLFQSSSHAQRLQRTSRQEHTVPLNPGAPRRLCPIQSARNIIAGVDCDFTIAQSERTKYQLYRTLDADIA